MVFLVPFVIIKSVKFRFKIFSSFDRKRDIIIYVEKISWRLYDFIKQWRLIVIT
jgi:hypothetical protein